MLIHLKFGARKAAQKALAEDSVKAPERAAASAPAGVLAEEAPAAPPEKPVVKPPAPRTHRLSGPRIKTYPAASIPAAINLARRELGEDAILIQSKRLEHPADPEKSWEVTFGIIPGGPAPARAEFFAAVPEPEISLAPLAPPAPAPAAANSSETDFARELGSLRRELVALQSMLLQSPNHPAAVVSSAPSVYSILIRNDVDRDLAADLQRALDEQLRQDQGAHSAGERDEETVRTLFTDHLAARVRLDSSLAGDAGAPAKPVMLIGPPAAGKTTVLMKLAVEFGVKRGKRVEIISLHQGKPDGNAALGTMSGLLGIPFQPVSSIETFESALTRTRNNGALVLVDTHGFGCGSLDEDRDLAEVLESGDAADVHLVLASAWHPASLRKAVDRFEILRPSRLLFTMADQAAVFGPMIQESIRTGKALSFISDGATGSGAIRPARLDWIVDRLWQSAGDRSN